MIEKENDYIEASKYNEEKGVDNMKLESEHIILCESGWEDLETFYEWERLPEVTEFFSIRDGQTKEEVIRKYIADDRESCRQMTMYAKKVGQEPLRIGRVVIADIEPGWKAELWRIYIGELSFRGLGYGKEAMELVMGYCFEELGIERLYLDHYTGNPASFLYLSLGFQYEGVLRKNCRKNGILYDVHLMSMLKEEYDSIKLTKNQKKNY